MDDILLAISVSALAFLSTSLDNFFLLITLSMHPKYGVVKVRLGYLVAVIIMLVISFGFAHGVKQLPMQFIPYIGLIPIGIGLYELWQLFRSNKSKAIVTPEDITASGGSFLTITLIMITHSWDSIAVLTPLLSDTRPGLLGWMSASVLAAAALFTTIAQKIVTHARTRNLLERFAPKILPLLLIAVGLYILTNTSTDIT